MDKKGFNQTPKTLPKYITQEEISNILGKAKKDRYRNYILLLTMSRTGMRVSEIVKLKKQDIVDNTIIVRQGKNKKDRVIPLENNLESILGLYADGKKPRTRLFPISERQVRNIVYKYSPKGMKVHPHTIRHSFAVHCLKQGMNLRSLQKILGHSNLTTTQVYLDLVGKDIEDDFKKVVF
jgi:site-specific recombinase XerD